MEFDAADMNSLITQCPNCQTAFHMNAAQLSAADGNVRCGACLHVFVAEENFLDIAPGKTAFLDEVEPDEVTDSDIETEYEPDLESENEHEQALNQEQDLEAEPSNESSLGWELIDESNANEVEPETEHDSDSPQQQQMLLDDDFDSDSDGRAEPSLFAARRAALEADLHDEDDPVRFSDDNRAALRSVDSPVELNSNFRLRVSAVRLAAQVFLFLVLFAGVALQLIWFNRDTLSMQAEWRPRLDMLCTVFGCTVPPQRDLTAIISDSLEVRSHPGERGALLVNLSFSNQAAFAQPFPALTLRFTDTEQQLVASRRFLPGEYLQEELHTMDLMPPGTSVQAQLDIVDPGTDAVNYEVFLGNLD